MYTRKIQLYPSRRDHDAIEIPFVMIRSRKAELDSLVYARCSKLSTEIICVVRSASRFWKGRPSELSRDTFVRASNWLTRKVKRRHKAQAQEWYKAQSSKDLNIHSLVLNTRLGAQKPDSWWWRFRVPWTVLFSLPISKGMGSVLGDLNGAKDHLVKIGNLEQAVFCHSNLQKASNCKIWHRV